MTEIPPAAGTVLTAFDGTTSFERAVGGFDAGEIKKAAHDFLNSLTLQEYTPLDEPERRGDFASPVRIDPLDMSTQEKLDRCRDLHQRVKGRDPRIVNVQVIYREFNEHSIFGDAGADLAQRVLRVNMFLILIAAGPGGEVRYDFASKSGCAGWEVLEWSDEDIQKLLDGALALLNAERIRTGRI